LLRDMRNVYPNASTASNISPSLNSVLNDLYQLNTVRTMQVTERLNSAVFNSSVGMSNIRVYRCGTTTSIGTNNLNAVSLNLTGTITASDAETQYCTRFNARIIASPPSGSQLINTAGN